MKLLTLTDLYNYYSSTKKSCHFSSVNNNENLVVQVEGRIKFEKSDKDTEGLCPVYLQACHIDENINGSNIKKDVMTAALPSFSNRPILGYIHKVNGQYEFYGHNIHMEDDELVYDEVPIGIIPESCEAKLVYDEDKEQTYVEVKGFIFEEYSKAKEILEREGECFVSVELSIRELSYDAKNKYLDIEDFFFSGVTILGKNSEGETVKPGMTGSNIKLADFSKKNNSMFSQDNKLIEVLEKLNTTLSGFSNINLKTKEGGNETNMFEKLLEKYSKTVEDITFDYAELSDEQLENKFAEMFEEAETDTDGSGGEPSNNGEGDSVADPEPASEGDEGNDDSGEKVTEPKGDEGDPEPTGEQEGEQFEQKENLVRTYEVSHDDIRNAIYNLLLPYEEADNEYYWIMEVFDNRFVYQGMSGKVYGQKYTVDGDNVTFDGERYELFLEYLTESEKAELEAMRSNYEIIESQLKEYQIKEETAQKDALFVSEDYSSISDKEEFKALAENHAEFSVDELKSQLDAIILDYAKKGNLNFSAEPEKKTVGMTKLPIQTKNNKKSRYGSLFSK